MTRFRILLAIALAATLNPCHAQTDAGTYKATTLTTPWELRAGAGTGALLSTWPTVDECTTAAVVYATKQAAKKDSKATCRPPASNTTITYTPPVVPPAATWEAVGPEKAGYTLDGRYRVRFGDGKAAWAVRVVEGAFWCGTGTFGDPAPGAAKRCERESAKTSEPVSAAPEQPTTPATPTTPTEPTTPTVPVGGVPKPEDFLAYPFVSPIVARTGQVIERVRVRSTSGSCITIPAGVTDVTIRDAEIGPCGQPGDAGAKGIDIQSGASRITVQRNYIHDMATGLYANGARHPIIFERNYVTNIRGPFPRGQMVQFNGVKSGAEPSKVTCNVSDTQGAEYSNVEDHINMFDSGGAGAGALRTEIAYNRIRGGHPTSNSGTAIMVGDGASGGNAWVHDNTVVNVRNVGIGVAGGVGIEVAGNRVFMDRAATYTNVGLYVWSQGGGACSGHSVIGNRAWVNNSNGAQNPWWNGGNCGTVTMAGNVWPDDRLTAAIFNEVPAQCR